MVNKDKTIINFANALSIIRMLLAPVFMIYIFRGEYKIAFFVILFATITDFLDGQVARIWNMQTRLGKLLDPMADKVIITFAVLSLLIKNGFPLWIGGMIILRDIIIAIIAINYLRKNKNKVLKPNLLGKITTFFQMAALIIFIIDSDQILNWTILVITFILTITSGIIYAFKAKNLFKKKKSKINLPNKITLIRIILIPIFIGILLSGFRYKYEVSAILFSLLALSDALDGYIARKRNQITSFGQLVDPLADKLLVSAALIFLIGKGVDAWMAYTIIAREFAVTGMRMVALTKHQVIPASKTGKLKTIIQIIAILLVLIQFKYSWEIMLLATIITVYSGVEYLWNGRHHFKELT